MISLIKANESKKKNKKDKQKNFTRRIRENLAKSKFKQLTLLL